MLRILFIHQNLPGQFRRLMRYLQTRPDVELVAIGEEFDSYRAALCAELADSVDCSRVHFLGKLPYASYRTVLQVSSLHIYLTYPFVLSWSMLEAMAAGLPACLELLKPLRPGLEEGNA